MEHVEQIGSSPLCRPVRGASWGDPSADVLHACCAGLDVHKKTVVACVRRVAPTGRVTKSIKTFAAMTADLLDLSDWLVGQGVKVVAMESTGSYWKPVFNLLEGRFEVVLVNAHHIKQVPGRKTDVKDCEWVAQLLQHVVMRIKSEVNQCQSKSGVNQCQFIFSRPCES